MTFLRWPQTLALMLLVAAVGCGKGRSLEVTTEAPLALTFMVSTNVITVGDPVHLTLEALHPVEGHVTWDEPDHPAAMVRDRSSDTEVLDEERARTVIHYAMTSFAPNTNFVWEGNVTYHPAEGDPHQQAIPFRSIEVLSVLPEGEAEPAGIKGLASWPARSTRWFWVFGLIALLALAAAIVAARFAARNPELELQPPPPPAHEAALRALAALRSRRWIEEQNIEPFYVELSDIARHYIEDRFSLHAPEQTTEEFIRAATSSRRLSMDHQLLTQEFLTQCDLVKFARHTPGRSDMESAFTSAERLVQETKEPEPNGVVE